MPSGERNRQKGKDAGGGKGKTKTSRRQKDGGGEKVKNKPKLRGGGKQIKARTKYSLDLNSFEPWVLDFVGVKTEQELLDLMIQKPVNGKLPLELVAPKDLKSWTFCKSLQIIFPKA